MEFLRFSGVRFESKYMHEDIAFAAQAAFRAKSIVSIREPIVEYVTNPNSLTRRHPTRANLESYLATYISLFRLMQTFGLVCDEYRPLALQIWNAHCTNDFGPKLIECYSKMGPALFADELLSIVEQRLGRAGLAIGDLVWSCLEQVAVRDVALEAQNRGQIAHQVASQIQNQTLKLTGAFKQISRKAFGLKGPELSNEEMLSIAWEQFGLAGFALGDLLVFLFGQIARRDALLLQNYRQVARRDPSLAHHHWRVGETDELFRQALEKLRPFRTANQ